MTTPNPSRQSAKVNHPPHGQVLNLDLSDRQVLTGNREQRLVSLPRRPSTALTHPSIPRPFSSSGLPRSLQRALSVSSLPLDHQATPRELALRRAEFSREGGEGHHHPKAPPTTPTGCISWRGLGLGSRRPDLWGEKLLTVQGRVYTTQSEINITGQRKFWSPGVALTGISIGERGTEDRPFLANATAEEENPEWEGQGEEFDEDEEEEEYENDVQNETPSQGASRAIPPPTYGGKSILIEPPDNKTLMKAGEFRGQFPSSYIDDRFLIFS